MFKHLHFFETPQAATVVALPFPLEQFLQDWSQLRSRMAREMAPAFARDEWAYLMTFLERDNLLRAFEQSFGKLGAAASVPVAAMARPRGPVAIWLPNNVSLLGPLTMVLMSLTGNPLRLKGGSGSEDLAGAFLDFARGHTPPGALRSYLLEQVRHEVFEREDPRNREMAATAMMRIVFGSDAAAEAIHALPHPLESLAFSFVDRRSEAWLEKAALSETVLRDLLKVFAIYGQAGCTSPRRVVVLGGSLQEAASLRDQLADLWPQVIKRSPAAQVASSNIMARQWAAALGWDARLTAQHGAVLAVGGPGVPEFAVTMGLMIMPATVAEALASLPPNIQTLGYSLTAPTDQHCLRILAQTRAKRLVPIAAMHHFGPVWDGQAFWRQAFEEIEVQ
jgi:hypothetical protein